MRCRQCNDFKSFLLAKNLEYVGNRVHVSTWCLSSRRVHHRGVAQQCKEQDTAGSRARKDLRQRHYPFI